MKGKIHIELVATDKQGRDMLRFWEPQDGGLGITTVSRRGRQRHYSLTASEAESLANFIASFGSPMTWVPEKSE